MPKQPTRGPARKPPRKLSTVSSKDEYTRLPGLLNSTSGLRAGSVSQAGNSEDTGIDKSLSEKILDEENENAIVDDEPVPETTAHKEPVSLPVKRPAPVIPAVSKLERPVLKTRKLERPERQDKTAITSSAGAETPQEAPGDLENQSSQSLPENLGLETPPSSAAEPKASQLKTVDERNSITRSGASRKSFITAFSEPFKQRYSNLRSSDNSAAGSESVPTERGSHVQAMLRDETVVEPGMGSGPSENSRAPKKLLGSSHSFSAINKSNEQGQYLEGEEGEEGESPEVEEKDEDERKFDEPAEKDGEAVDEAAKFAEEGQEENEEEEQQQADEEEKADEEQKPAVRVPQYDDAGRLIVDPTDLPKRTRTSGTLALVDGIEHVLDEEKFTMAEMCRDLPIGTVSSKYEKYVELMRKKKDDRREKRAIRTLLKSDSSRVEELYKYRTELQRQDAERRQQSQSEAREILLRGGDDGTTAVPQLKIGESGELSLDMESTIVDRHRNNQDAANSMTRVDADDIGRTINSASYSRHERPERWDANETEEFYKAISMWGTDFSLISKLFPGRSRRQVKSKYKLEEKKNPTKLHLATIRKLPVDVERYTNLLQLQKITLQETKDVEAKIETVRNEFEQRVKEEADSVEKMKKEDADRAQQRETERMEELKAKAKEKQEMREAAALLKAE